MKAITANEYTGPEFEALIEDVLRRVLKSQRPDHSLQEPDDLLTVKACAELLSLSIPTIYGKLHRRELPAMKRGKRVYFRRSEILEYLEQGRKKTISEIQAEANCSIANNKRSRK